MSKSKKKDKQSSSALNRILIIQLIVILGLSLFITNAVSKATRQNTIEHLTSIADERAQIVKTYVQNSENTLKAFAKAKQVSDLLAYSKQYDLATLTDPETPAENKDPAGKEAQAVAQKFTTDFGNDIENLEGLWIGSWDTHVMTHTNPALPESGMQTRKDLAKQQELQNAMRNGRGGLYDTGFIISPGSGKQCLSMYQAVYDDNGNPMGFAGLGIFTSGVIETLDSVPMKGVEHSTYKMVDAKSGNYIFGVAEDQINTQTDNQNILALCSQYSGTSQEVTGNFTYRQGGKQYISIWTYIPEYDWIILIDDDTAEAFSLMRTMIIYLAIFGVVIISLIVVFNIITKRQEKVNQKLVSTIAKNNMTRKSLNTAMFNDVLTGASNRVSFSMNAEKMGDAERYFVMFNIAAFSDINTVYGNDAGDLILVNTVNTLKEYFPDKEIYRTGSDEFIVDIPAEGDFAELNAVMDKVNIAFRMLVVPFELEDGTNVYPKYKIAVVKKGNGIDSSIIATLKDMTNKTGEATYGLIDFLDLDAAM